MSSPLPFLKPLSLEDRLLIDVVTKEYEGVSSPWIVWEDEKTVRLMVPDKIRRISYATKTVETQEVSTFANRGLSDG
jgi:hypothetical protein